MKRLFLFILLLAAIAFALLPTLASAQTKTVNKTISNNGLTESLVVPSGKTLTIASGATIAAAEGSTITGFTASATWGGITGTLSSQTDLQTALDAKANASALSGYLTTSTAASTYQPLDGDLTAIAALTTTSYGRELLTRADAAAVRSALSLGTLATQTATITDYLTIASAASTYAPIAGVSGNWSVGGNISLTGSLATGAGNIETTVGNISTGSGIISGNGSSITALNASNIASGTLNIARITDASITNAKLANSSITINGTAVALGGSVTTSTAATTQATIHPDVAPAFWFDAYAIVANASQPANGTAVSTWDDLASSTSVTQGTSGNQPVFIERHEISGRPCVRFDGGDWLSRTNNSISATSGHTLIAVMRVPAANANFQFLCSGSADNGGVATWFGWQANRVPTRYDASGNTSSVSLATPTFDKISVVAYRVSSSERAFWVGQTKVYSASVTTLPTTLQFSHVGAYNNTSFGLVGDLFELMGFATPLSDAQLAEIVAGLESKWGCEHEMLIIDGNSLFAGAAGGNGIHSALRSALGRKWWVPTFALVGQTTAQMRSDFATQIAPFCGPRLDGRRNLLLFTEFRNHLATSGVSYATAWSEYQSYVSDGTTAGARVIATTMLPATSGMPSNNWTEANRTQGNSDIVSAYTSASNVSLWNWATDYQASWLSGGDGIHLTYGIGEPDAVRAFLVWMQAQNLYR